MSNTNVFIPAGFQWSAAGAGIKHTNRDDIGLMVAKSACAASAVFTRNGFAAAPVVVSRELFKKQNGKVAGCVANSGCANAATGEQGLANAREMSQTAATQATAEGALAVCSTGVIGVQLPMEKVRQGIASAASSLASDEDAFRKFARCILTTDTHEKIASAEIHDGAKVARIIGCAKGAGMMYPRMATMLAFIATDVQIQPQLLQRMFSFAIERSLNCVTVDGDTSTNDTALIFASGASGLEIHPGAESKRDFSAKLLEVLQSLAKQLARDGEGATKLVEVVVHGGHDFDHARMVARAIANSNLVKTAIYGRDANWGRIVCAIGNADSAISPNNVTVNLGSLKLFEKGKPLPLDEESALRELSQECVRIEAELGCGRESATVWTCDLTEKYIEINGSYRT